jgi:hypothetical protein
MFASVVPQTNGNVPRAQCKSKGGKGLPRAITSRPGKLAASRSRSGGATSSVTRAAFFAIAGM